MPLPFVFQMLMLNQSNQQTRQTEIFFFHQYFFWLMLFLSVFTALDGAFVSFDGVLLVLQCLSTVAMSSSLNDVFQHNLKSHIVMVQP